MSAPAYKEAREAQREFPALLRAAEKGGSTVITRRGHAVAALVPISVHSGAAPQHSLLPLAGSGRGLGGKGSRRTIQELRDE
jgi:prevent-host-death family protein